MSAKSFREIIVLAVALVCIFGGYVQADKLQLLEKLSTDVDVQLRDVTIAEALDVIGRQAGVKFALSDEAVWKLPQGEGTRLSVTLEGPLSDSMTEMLNAFFMRYAVGDEEVTIYPRAELEHVIGRPSTKQLELLTRIYSMSISVESGVSRDVAVRLIKDAFGALSFMPYYVSEDIYKVLESMGTPVTLAVLLEQVGFEQNAPYWYLSGMDFPDQIPTIRVVNEQDFREAKLDQVVDISFKNETADVIVQRLAGWAGMELVVDKEEPSWLEGEIIVNMQNIKLRQALRNIVSSVDGEMYIDVGDNDIRIQGPRLPQKIAAPRKAKSSAGAAEGYVGKISIPMDGGKYYIEFMLRESDLTEELKRLRDEKIKEVSGKSAGPAATPRK
jgi:hypothetical protein